MKSIMSSAEPPQTALLPIEQSLKQAIAHHQAGQLQGAGNLYRAILQTQPNHPDANHNMGKLMMQAGQQASGLQHLKTALESNPSQGQYWLSYADALLASGQAMEALIVIQTAMQNGLDTPEAQILLQKADAAVRDNHATDIPATSEQPTQIQIKTSVSDQSAPASTELDYLIALFDAGRYAELEIRTQALVEQYPAWLTGWKMLSDSLLIQGKDARLPALRALELNPEDAAEHCYCGIVLKSKGEINGAVKCFQRALELRPNYAEAHNNLGIALKELGRFDEAFVNFQRALEIKPDYTVAYSNLLFLYSRQALIDPHEYLALARNWEHACLPAQDHQVAQHRIFQRLPLAGRRLRVGYVSGDYRQHAVSYFIEQLFTHHDRTRIELFAYSTYGQTDAATERLQALVEHWVSVAGMSEAAARDCIEADGIDVLIDLSGHAVFNRLGIFARRAAPVQAHYLGYFASTGLAEMDYWIGDEILTPPETGSHFSEQLWRLPRVWVSYEGKADAPVPNWQPRQDGTVWLGSFNNLGKLTPATLALWAKVLHALPEGKLLLKTKELRDIGNRQRILDALSSHGISSDRIELQDSNATPDWSAHMTYYDRLDIALDPVGGQGGGTTTCDALWMGVPVMALEGDRMASRMTASMLDAIGHPEWIAHSEEEYSDKVVALARDVGQRKALRSVQRKQMASSPLCDAKNLAMNLEGAYFEMFERWLNEKLGDKN